jgi:hypothetical protein
MFAELGLGPPPMDRDHTHPRFPQEVPKPPFGGAATSHMDESGAHRGGAPAAPLETKGGFRPKRVRGKKEPQWGKQIRPTSLQKFCKRFNGSGDPYDHVAQYRQLLYAEGVTDVHTMV